MLFAGFLMERTDLVDAARNPQYVLASACTVNFYASSCIINAAMIYTAEHYKASIGNNDCHSCIL